MLSASRMRSQPFNRNNCIAVAAQLHNMNWSAMRPFGTWCCAGWALPAWRKKSFRKVQGYQDLWVLAAALGRANKSVTPQEKVA